MLLGLVPKSNLTAQLLLILVMALKINVPVALACAAVVSLINVFTDSFANPIGLWLLTNLSLKPFWTYLYNTPVVPWTNFNNTLVLGNLVLGILLFIPCYFAGKTGAVFYDARVKTKIKNSAFIKGIKTSWLFDWYFRF